MYILKVMVISVALSPGNPETAGAKPRLDDVAYRETLPGLIEKKMVEQFQFISVY